MLLSFKEFFGSDSYTPAGIGGGSYVPDTWSNSDSFLQNLIPWDTMQLPYTDFMATQRPVDIPKITKMGFVTKFLDKQNPIVVELACGTKVFLSLEQYKRIKGDLPIVPKYTFAKITFQRVPHDRSLNVSKVDSITCKFMGNSGLAAQYNVKPNLDAMML